MPKPERDGLKMSNLRGIMEEAVARQGVISFARFMELALYCPNFGYYECQDVSPGQKGDFFTSVSTGALFGELLACQFADWLDLLPGKRRQILEAGAHDGRLAADILHWLQANRPDLFGSLDYWILEPSAIRRQSQEKTLHTSGLAARVKWSDSWTTLPKSGVRGIIFSNELLDALPVHRLGWDARQRKWFEWGVALHDGGFIWTRVPKSRESKIPATHLKLPPALLQLLPDNFTTEVCPAAVRWWRRAARALKRGKLLTLDYGLMAEEFFAPQRKSGTLRAYHRHHQTHDVLARVGEQDITAHVNFTAIRDAGEAAGLRTESLLSQAQFFTAIVERMCAKSEAFRQWIPSRSREFQTLTHPEHLGQSFRVLVQER